MYVLEHKDSLRMINSSATTVTNFCSTVRNTAFTYFLKPESEPITLDDCYSYGACIYFVWLKRRGNSCSSLTGSVIIHHCRGLSVTLQPHERTHICKHKHTHTHMGAAAAFLQMTSHVSEQARHNMLERFLSFHRTDLLAKINLSPCAWWHLDVECTLHHVQSLYHLTNLKHRPRAPQSSALHQHADTENPIHIHTNTNGLASVIQTRSYQIRS